MHQSITFILDDKSHVYIYEYFFALNCDFLKFVTYRCTKGKTIKSKKKFLKAFFHNFCLAYVEIQKS